MMGCMGWKSWVGYIDASVLEVRSLFRKLGAVLWSVRVGDHETHIRAWSCWDSGFGFVLERVMLWWLLFADY